MQLGRILPRLPREKLLVQTKLAPSADPKEFRAAFEKSIGYLRLDYVDLFSLHGINNDETLSWSHRCLCVARQLQQEGRVRFVGFSTHGPTRVIINAIETDEFDYVNLHWYFVNPLNWPAVEAAARRDMGVFIISPNDKGGMLQQRPDKMARLCAPLTPMQFNDLYCLARPEVHTLSIGAAQPTDFDEHIAALAYLDRAAAAVAPIEARLRAEMERVLGADWCARWAESLPEHTAVPGDINISEILRLWTFANSLDLVPWGKMRYNLLGNAGHWFPGQMAREFDDQKMRQVCAANPFADRIPGILRAAHQLLFDTPKQRLSQE
jgi:predicted aldo/keto reductase-like oxidoreductase